MYVQVNQPPAHPQQLIPYLQPLLPTFRYTIEGGKLVANHTFAAVIVSPKGLGYELGTGMPMMIRLLMVVGFVGGLLPGLLVAGLYYALLSSTLGAMKTQLAAALAGHPIPPGPGSPLHLQRPTAGAVPAVPQFRPTVGPLAPMWLFAASVGLLLVGGGLGYVAYEDGYDDIDWKQDNVRFAKADIETAEATLERAESSWTPPATGCDTPGYRYSRSATCFGCSRYTQKPADPGGRRLVRRDKERDWLACPGVETAEYNVEQAEQRLDDARAALQAKRDTAIYFGAGAILALAAHLITLIVWLVKNAPMRRKRRDERVAFEAKLRTA